MITDIGPEAALSRESGPTGPNWSLHYAAQRQFDSTARIGTITAPTLVLGGDCDHLVPAPDMRQLASAIPNAELNLFRGCGNLINVESPALFDGELIEFFWRTH